MTKLLNTGVFEVLLADSVQSNPSYNLTLSGKKGLEMPELEQTFALGTVEGDYAGQRERYSRNERDYSFEFSVNLIEGDTTALLGARDKILHFRYRLQGSGNPSYTGVCLIERIQISRGAEGQFMITVSVQGIRDMVYTA